MIYRTSSNGQNWACLHQMLNCRAQCYQCWEFKFFECIKTCRKHDFFSFCFQNFTLVFSVHAQTSIFPVLIFWCDQGNIFFIQPFLQPVFQLRLVNIFTRIDQCKLKSGTVCIRILLYFSIGNILHFWIEDLDLFQETRIWDFIGVKFLP